MRRSLLPARAAACLHRYVSSHTDTVRCVLCTAIYETLCVNLQTEVTSPLDLSTLTYKISRSNRHTVVDVSILRACGSTTIRSVG
jgi:hypothetical protein